MKGIRLSDDQITIIRSVFKECFLQEDQLWIFGSRADLSKRGGDIDLYVETKLRSADEIYEAENKFFCGLIRKLGDQKIDLVINSGSGKKLIYAIAKKTGVQLI
jgi:hypothetical protein